MKSTAEPATDRSATVGSGIRGPLADLLLQLATDDNGLDSAEAQHRLRRDGPNSLPQPRRRGLFTDVARQVTHPLALLLWLASGLSAMVGALTMCLAIIAVIGVNAFVALLQERQAAHAVDALAAYLPPHARVLRDGHVQQVRATDLVVGDVIVLTEGDGVCADARLVAGALEVNMSALTGESAPVSRSAGRHDDTDRLIDLSDALFSGTSCIGGEGRAVVFATGSATELGRIASLSQRTKSGESPLERQVRRSAWLIAGVAIGIGALFLPLGLLAGLSLGDSAVFAVGLLVANVPEGLLPTITLALAVGVRVLARSGAIVKRLSAVETLGSTTVICTDKTGTLTAGIMSVVRVWIGGRSASADEPQRATMQLAQAMADCNDVDLTVDPMEIALRKWSESHKVKGADRVATFPFDSIRKRMSVVVQQHGHFVVEVKGAPEQLLDRCTEFFDGERTGPLTSQKRAEASAALDALTADGLRVLAVAVRQIQQVPENSEVAESCLTLLGLVALLDPPRPEVAAAVSACHTAGIRVNVITGDHANTAREIARQVGINARYTLGGGQTDSMADAALGELLRGGGDLIFARSTPEGKLRIAEALSANGDVVAMTGDGVNDAPALARADIGIAMGRSGTDVARESATMILTDDNFATIVTAVREGRRAYDNLRKFVLYIFAHAVPEVVPFAVFALSAGHIPLPLTVLQILAIDLDTETLPAVALGREPAEPDLMTRPPRPRGEHLITGGLLKRAWLLMGAISAVLAMAIFFAVLLHAGWHPGDNVRTGSELHHAYLQATTATFAAIIACQVGVAFAARTERASLRAVGVSSNPLLLGGIIFEITFAAMLCYVPQMQSIFGTAALPLWVLLLLLPCPVLVWGADELIRWIRRRNAHLPFA